jgi:hypothetical protein
MQLSDPDARRIADFLRGIGIRIRVEPLVSETFLPGVTIRGGELVVDPARLGWPGDLLHEAGHIACTDPALRPDMNLASDEPGEEMAAIAWSWAAANAIGLDPEILFHDGGYRGGSAGLIDNFRAGRWIGVPMLSLYGMSDEPHRPRAGIDPYPNMRRWLR